jgi:hypothetical protein
MRIESPAASITYSLWLRSRVIIGASVAGTFALGGAAALLDPIPRAVAGMVAAMPFITGLALLIGVVTYGGADLSTPESVYPRHVMVYPARTRVLVAVPMLFGTLIVAAFYLVAGRIALYPAGLRLPVVWPAATMGATVAWLQAASWSPYRYPFLRAGVILLVIIVLAPLGVAGQVHHVHPAVVLAASGIVAALAYPVALAGVARARRGEGIGPAASRKEARGAAAPVVKAGPFVSGAAAQFWFDLRRNIWYPPAITALVQLLLLITFVAGRGARPNVFLPAWVPPGAVPLLILLAVPVFILMVHAVAFGKFDMWSKPLEFPAFLLTRPVSTAQIVTAKLRSAAAVTLLVWAVTSVFVLAFVSVPRSYDAAHSWAEVIGRNASLRHVVGSVTMILILLILTWSQIARSLWISMSGKIWLVHGFPSLAMALMGVLGWVAYRIHQNPPLEAAIIARASGVIVGLAGLKILASTAVFGYLRRRSLTEAESILRAYGWWFVASLVVCAGLMYAAPTLRHAAFTVWAALMLLVPLVRPALAVLSLQYNRHR